MKRVVSIGIAATLFLTVGLISLSCKKKEEAPKGVQKQEVTPEQKKQVEEIKKGVEESKEIIVAKVNGAEITMFSLIREMNRIADRYIKPGEKSTPATDEKVKKEALDRLIFEELAIQEARKQGIVIKPERVDEIIKRLKAQMGSEEAYKDYLQQMGGNEKVLKQRIERSHLFDTITAKEIYSKITPDEKTVRAEYQKNKEKFVTKGDPPHQMTFEEAKPFIERKIKGDIGEKKIAEWGKELRKTAKVEILLAEVEKSLKARAQ